MVRSVLAIAPEALVCPGERSCLVRTAEVVRRAGADDAQAA